MAAKSLCKIENCGKPRVTRGWCHMHYGRWKNNGDPLALKKAANGEALRFYEDVVLNFEGLECLQWPYARNRKGYARLGQKFLVSRLVCEKVHGPAPTSEHQAAHSCGKGHEACVTKLHLSWKTPIENDADKTIHGTRSSKAIAHLRPG